MKINRFKLGIVPCAAFVLAFTAQAQNAVSYVSTTGSDSNTCTASAHCRTIAKALTETKSGGEVVVLDSGSYGNGSVLTISQPVTVSAVGVDASISITTSGVNAITINTTGGVNLTGLTLHGHAAGNEGILVTQVGVLRLNNVTIEDFTLDGVNFESPGDDLVMYNSQANDNGRDGLRVNAAGAHAYVEGSAFDRNAFAGGDSVLGKLTISDSNAHFNEIGFLANGGTVTLYNARSIFNKTGLEVSASGHMHFANCLVSDNTAAWNVAPGGVLSGSDPGTTLIAPGQTPNTGTRSAATVLD
jgi:hypothetical protein